MLTTNDEVFQVKLRTMVWVSIIVQNMYPSFSLENKGFYEIADGSWNESGEAHVYCIWKEAWAIVWKFLLQKYNDSTGANDTVQMTK